MHVPKKQKFLDILSNKLYNIFIVGVDYAPYRRFAAVKRERCYRCFAADEVRTMLSAFRCRLKCDTLKNPDNH